VSFTLGRGHHLLHFILPWDVYPLTTSPRFTSPRRDCQALNTATAPAQPAFFYRLLRTPWHASTRVRAASAHFASLQNTLPRLILPTPHTPHTTPTTLHLYLTLPLPSPHAAPLPTPTPCNTHTHTHTPGLAAGPDNPTGITTPPHTTHPPHAPGRMFCVVGSLRPFGRTLAWRSFFASPKNSSVALFVRGRLYGGRGAESRLTVCMLCEHGDRRHDGKDWTYCTFFSGSFSHISSLTAVDFHA